MSPWDSMYCLMISSVTLPELSKIASGPKMLSPGLSPQFSKLFQHLAATPSLEALHQVTHRDLRWHWDQQVYMVNRDMPTFDVHIQCGTRQPDQLPPAYRDLTAQHLLPIFGNPHQVVFEVIDRVRCFAIVYTHIVPQSCPQPDLTSSGKRQCGVENGLPKGRGFYPIYRQ